MPSSLLIRIAIFGSTSWIAKYLIQSLAAESRDELVLYARRQENVRQWLGSVGLSSNYSVVDFSVFSMAELFGLIHYFVGVENPVQAALVGASTFDV